MLMKQCNFSKNSKPQLLIIQMTVLLFVSLFLFFPLIPPLSSPSHFSFDTLSVVPECILYYQFTDAFVLVN